MTWADGETSDKSFTVNINEDEEAEETEIIKIILFNLTGEVSFGSPAQTTITISDNNESGSEGIAGTLQFATGNYPAPEGYNPTISITRIGGSDGEISVQYLATGDSTATNTDYANASGTLTWADDDSNAKSFTVSTNDDSEAEATETIELTLSNPTGGASLGSQAQTTISITDNNVATTSEEPVTPVTTSKPTTTPSSTPEPAMIPSSTVTSEPATSSETTSEPVATSEPLATPTTTPSSATTSPTGASGTSEAGILQFAATTNIAGESEGELQKIIVNRTGGNLGEVSVQYLTTIASTATFGSDFMGGNGTLAWANGDTQPKILPITILHDDEKEALETINLMLYNPSNQAVLGLHALTTLVITDSVSVTSSPTGNDLTSEDENLTAGTLQFSASFYTVKENISSLTPIIVTRKEGSQGDISVAYTIDGGSASLDYDFVGGSGELIWGDGDTAPKSIPLMILDDKQVEDLETIPLMLAEPTGGATLGTIPRTSLVVVDNDGQAEVPSQLQTEGELTYNSSSAESKPIIAPLPDPSEYALPSLGRGMAVTKNGSMLDALTLEEVSDITIAFRGGASVNKQSYQANLGTMPSKMVSILGEIDIAEAHIGQEADILIVAGVLAEMSEVISLFLMLDSKEQIQVWNGEFVTLIGSEENVILSPTQRIEIYHGLIEPVRVQIYFGYRLKETGTIYFNGEQPIEVWVEEEYEYSLNEQNSILFADLNHAGNQLVTASKDGIARLWDIEAGNRLALLRGHTDAMTTAMFNPDGDTILTASKDGTARLWDVATNQEVMVLKFGFLLIWFLAIGVQDLSWEVVMILQDLNAKLKLFWFPRRRVGTRNQYPHHANNVHWYKSA